MVKPVPRMNQFLYVGVDPGVNGGVAYVADNLSMGWMAFKDKTERDIFRFFYGLPGAAFAYIEKIAGTPPGRSQQGIAVINRSYGFLRGILTACDIPFEEVTPVVWQRSYGLLRTKKTETDTQKKARHKAKAEQLFPTVRITHGVADAFLIAEFCRRSRTHA